MQIFKYIFTFLCIFTTLSMIYYWGYKFSLDEDISVITYRKFYEREDDVYPTASICLENPFLKQRLAEYGVNQSLYLKYLRGEYFSENMLRIPYKNVTIDISNYIKGYILLHGNGSAKYVKFDSGSYVGEKRILTHVSYNGFSTITKGFNKCFALEIPRVKHLQVFRILLSNRLFPNGLRPTYAKLSVFYHFPRQFLLAGRNVRWTWPYRAANESYKTRFLIGAITILKQRNKQQSRCIEACDAYDNWVMKFHQNEIECNIPYLKLQEQIPICNSKEQMKQGIVKRHITEMKDLIEPCKVMENINVQHLESIMKSDKSTVEGHVGEFWFSVGIKNSRFKEIEQKR